ncbi:hypothetical protein [Ferrovibrio sp.]|jgi:hypothetical protein|uniref:hypothetical protein n=1 Tax=Ferrovibrio sp. TaxID=1917215 RepID=UPI0035B1AC58
MQERHETTTTVMTVTTGKQVCWLGREPALSDMLADPITQMLMRRDGVQEGELRRLVARLQQRRTDGLDQAVIG